MNDALEVPNFFYGHGRIDVLAAVKKAIDLTNDVENVPVNNEVRVYPNPNAGSFTIESVEREKIDQITIMDITGRIVEVSKLKSSDGSYQVSDLPAGLYIYSLKIGSNIISGKVLVTE